MSESKVKKDLNRLQNLAMVAMAGLMARLLLYFTLPDFGGLMVEILWLPLILLVIALPFYAFDKLLDRIKKGP